MFIVVAKDGATAERELQIYMMASKESSVKGEMSGIGSVRSGENAAGLFTEKRLSEKMPG